MSDEEHPSRWYSTNLVGVPAGVLGSVAFNAHPQQLHIGGVREGNRGLFALLERCTTPAEARAVFDHYLTLAFGLAPSAEPRRWRTSVTRLLQGWGLDANGPAGAVLKGWVESRFGLAPSFHGAPLGRFPSPEWVRYLEQKAAPRWNNNGIHQQLDLLYEFCQWMLARFRPLGDGPYATLWRGSDAGGLQVLQGSLRERRCTLHLNNLVSFSRERETAQCFGDWVLRARVPASKLLLVPGLLDSAALDGESEVLALGGDYEVEVDCGP